MTRRDRMDPELALALEEHFGALAAAGSREAAVARRPGRLRQAVVTVLVAALVIGASVSVLVATSRSQPSGPPRPAPSITVDGHTLVDIGAVGWTDAQWVDAAHTTVRVVASRSTLHRSRVSNCGADAVRGVASETSAGLVIVTDGYADARIAGQKDVFCALSFRAPVAVVVRLQHSSGARTLLDGSTKERHLLLDPATLPTPAFIPAGMRASSFVRWDEVNDAATRIWYRLTPQKGSYVDYALNVYRKAGPVGSYGKSAGTIDVHGRRAFVFVQDDSQGWAAHVTWSAADGESLELVSHGTTRHHRPLTEIERVAQSVSAP